MAEEPTKSCYRCKVTKTLEEFHFDKSKPNGHVGICRSCVRSRDRSKYGRVRDKQIKDATSWKARNPDRYKNNQLRRSFGITLSDYNALAEAQGKTPTGRVKASRAIGMLQHDPDRTRSATAYLEASIQRRERTRAPAIWAGHDLAERLYQCDTGG